MAKITEKRLYAVPLQSLTGDGTTLGQIQVANACNLFVVGQLVVLDSNTQPSQILKVKRIPSDDIMLLGPDKTPIHIYSDVSAFLVADGATVEAKEQNRPSVPEQEIERITYAEEPTIARRVTIVDPCGDMISPTNPLSVQLSDGSINIGTVNAELEVQLSHKDNDPNVGDVHDSVRIGDGVETIAINPDGSINVVANISGGVITTPTIANVSVLLANTEYSYIVPTATKKIILKVRDGLSKTKLAFISGTSSTNYITVTPGTPWVVEGISSLVGFTLYFQTSKPNEIIEILTWT